VDRPGEFVVVEVRIFVSDILIGGAPYAVVCSWLDSLNPARAKTTVAIV
jgi:hypothetical protein